MHPFTLDGKAFCFCFLPGIQPGTGVNRFDTRCALQRCWIILPPQSKIAAGHLNAFRFATSSCSVRPNTSKSYRNIEWFECFKWCFKWCFMMLLRFPKCFPIGTRRGKVTQWPSRPRLQRCPLQRPLQRLLLQRLQSLLETAATFRLQVTPWRWKQCKGQ